MSQQVENRTVKIFIDDKDVQRSLDNAQKQFDKLTSRGKSLNVGTEKWQENEQAIARAQKQIELYSGQLEGKLGVTTKQLKVEVAKLNRELSNTPVELIKTSEAAAKLKLVEATLHGNATQVTKLGSSYNGLGHSINQLTREAPAFAMSIQTGFMALSNNIPMFIDEINKLKLANKELQASGKATGGVFGTIMAGIFSWQTALSVGVTLLTIYGKEIFNFIGSLFKGHSTIDETKTKIEALNEAFKDKAVVESVKNYLVLTEQIKQAKEGFLDKEKVLKTYNDTIGRTIGFATNLNAAETLLIKNKQAYITAMIERAAANSLYAKAAELIVQKQELLTKRATMFDVMVHSDSFTERKKREIAELDAKIEKLTKMAANLNSFESNAETPEERAKKDEKINKERADAAIKEAQRAFDYQMKLYDDEFKKAEQSAKEDIKLLIEKNKEKARISKQYFDDELHAALNYNSLIAVTDEEKLAAATEQINQQLSLDLASIKEGTNQEKYLKAKAAKEIANLNDKYKDKKEVDAKDDIKREKDKYKRIVDIAHAYVNELINVVGAFGNFMQAQDSLQAHSFSKMQEAKKIALKDQLENKLISQDEYNKRIIEIDKESERIDNERARNAAERDKKIAVFNSLLQAAMAWFQFWIEVDPLKKAALLISAIGASAQAAVIAAMPLPEFALGTDFAPGGLAIVGEQGPELVNLPRGSKVFTASQTTSMLNVPQFDFNRIGAASQNINNTSISNISNSGDTNLIKAIERLNNNLESPIIAYSLFGEKELFKLRKELTKQITNENKTMV